MLSENTGLPAAMENNSGAQKNSRNMRPQSMLHRICNAPAVRNILRFLYTSQRRSVMTTASPSFHQSEDKFEKITLTTDPK
jgi:hypothetical protein